MGVTLTGSQGLSSPKQTATGKDTSNPFMAVMTCQKSYSSSTYYDSCFERGKWFQSSMDLTLSGYVVPTGRVIATVSIKVPTGRYIVHAGYIISPGRVT
ncbi:hypothetical protein Tco_0286894 [Tanacetum coccineum]